jgi:hypothetical protein
MVRTKAFLPFPDGSRAETKESVWPSEGTSLPRVDQHPVGEVSPTSDRIESSGHDVWLRTAPSRTISAAAKSIPIGHSTTDAGSAGSPRREPALDKACDLLYPIRHQGCIHESSKTAAAFSCARCLPVGVLLDFPCTHPIASPHNRSRWPSATHALSLFRPPSLSRAVCARRRLPQTRAWAYRPRTLQALPSVSSGGGRVASPTRSGGLPRLPCGYWLGDDWLFLRSRRSPLLLQRPPLC